MTTDWQPPGWDGMSLDEKLALVESLWDKIGLSAAPGAPLTDAKREELRRRVADAEANPNDFVAWEDALEATMKRLSS